tara:strand:- start:1809 stop:2963 length:1155 start_codon:yes stop_codon:yes gene_type:complete
MSDAWSQSPENTLQSLRHGIVHTDGIELDVRLTNDNELVIHHDSIVSVAKERLEGRSKWLESWTLDELKEEGFCSLDDLLNDSEIREHWIERGKMVCLEFKRPHLLSPTGRGIFGKSRQINSLSTAMKMAESKLDQNHIPNQNSVFYSFYKGMKKIIDNTSIKRNWAELMPSIPTIGNRTIKRTYAFPQYFITPFSRLVKKHRDSGSSMVPCAMEYFSPVYSRALFGRMVGLHGKRKEYLLQCQRGLPTYVWPTKPNLEYSVLNAGLTALTDHLDPNLTWLPSGDARWLNPATMPLDKKQKELLDSASKEQHLSIIKQLKSDVPSWNECDTQRKTELIQYWRQKWNWDIDLDVVLTKSVESPPWQSVRLIGHRGSGKTSRPVMK